MGWVVLAAGLFYPYGLISLPLTAGLFGVLGALSPFLFMMPMVSDKTFRKTRQGTVRISP
jgi:hypothetical protein